MIELDLDALGVRYGPCNRATHGKCRGDHDPNVLDAVAELRRLREENARLEELLNRAARIASELTGFPWPLPAPPEVKP